MKSRILLAAIAILSFLIVKAQQTMPFKYGNPLPKEAFHGEAYINNIIANDSIFNFPQTNVILLPQARIATGTVMAVWICLLLAA